MAKKTLTVIFEDATTQHQREASIVDFKKIPGVLKVYPVFPDPKGNVAMSNMYTADLSDDANSGFVARVMKMFPYTKVVQESAWRGYTPPVRKVD